MIAIVGGTTSGYSETGNLNIDSTPSSRMTIDSTPGVGTTITLWLPVSADAARVQNTGPGKAFDRPSRTATILLVDDEELVRFADREIPKDQGLLMIPGEDLFYYSTGRRPLFPVVMFDHTINPYSPAEIAEVARQRKICWLIVKKHTQLNGEPVENKDQLLELLRGEYVPMKNLSNYEIFRRNADGGYPASAETPAGRN